MLQRAACLAACVSFGFLSEGIHAIDISLPFFLISATVL
jgi:hypothetical protein